MDLSTPEDIARLAETHELECKLALGADGRGEVPKDFWPTYSAMANAGGGVVLLGVREDQHGHFSVAGLPDPDRLRRDLFNTLGSGQKVSCNLLTDSHVQTALLGDKAVLVVRIPPATRLQRPVFVNGNPLTGTYRRLNDGDRQCNEETVRRMLAEQVEGERDNRILARFDLTDIDAESLRVYRQMLKDVKPEHPFLELDDKEFLRSIGGWRRDRETGAEGLTLAGLLMFGTWSSILEQVPHYMVDYQERPEAKVERRWVDRLVPDGTWSGNVFDFYRRVYRKLVADLKVPFELRGGQRQEDSPVHQALREALVNTLVHADYTGRVSILVVKRPDMFGFRNPGGLRLPLEQVLHGGESDCRNRLMHSMFLLIGLGERAGSGLPRILSSWRGQHWRQPLLRQKDEPEQTLLELQMLDLFPEGVLQDLRSRYGPKFDALGEIERLILATAALDGYLNHTRVVQVTGAHPRDVSDYLQRLERSGLLQTQGQYRNKVYFLHGSAPIAPESVFGDGPALRGDSEQDSASGPELLVSEGGGQVPGGPRPGTQSRDATGCLIVKPLSAPVVDSIDELTPQLREELFRLADKPRNSRRIDERTMDEAILAVCAGRYIRVSALAALLCRNPEGLRRRFLDRLVEARLVEMAFPQVPTHALQAYRAAPLAAEFRPPSG